MGLTSLSIHALPCLDIAHDGLPTALNGDVLDNNGLLAAVAMFAQRLHLRRVGAGQLGIAVGVGLRLKVLLQATFELIPLLAAHRRSGTSLSLFARSFSTRFGLAHLVCS